VQSSIVWLLLSTASKLMSIFIVQMIQILIVILPHRFMGVNLRKLIEQVQATHAAAIEDRNHGAAIAAANLLAKLGELM